jgi:two-component system, OmpR family, sensor kinase
MSAPSIVSRISRTLVLWVGVLWLACALWATWYVDHEVREGFDASLQESAHRLLDLVAHEMSEMVPSTDPSVVKEATANAATDAPQVENDYLLYQVVDAAGRMIVRSADAPATALAAPLQTGFFDTPRYRVYTLKHPKQPVFIHVADTMLHREDASRKTLVNLLLALLVLLPVVAWVVRYVSRKELAAVAKLSYEIALKDGDSLGTIAVLNLPLELQSISDSTNQLLARLDKALAIERSLAANFAHELRTPLAATRLLLSTAASMPMPDGARECVARAAHSVEALGQRAEKVLQLSRAEAASALAKNKVDLIGLACVITQDFWVFPGLLERLSLVVPEDAAVFVRGDSDSLAIALRNLIENAIKHAPASAIDLIVQAPATLIVRDYGAGVSADQLKELADRHVRLGSPAAGYGLGMSIVQKIVDGHGGLLLLSSPPNGKPHGFEVQIDLQAWVEPAKSIA